ncbi:hypothetical protein ACFQZT_15500 [Paenibacillus sp. GCM10027628]|uniref:hypothetical protein n=1 Tax=Paenibacillus sp. GCM10027628 TaxID=3273413 RepID=UPI0036339D26
MAHRSKRVRPYETLIEARTMLFSVGDEKVNGNEWNSDVYHRYRVEKGNMVSQSEAIVMFFIVTRRKRKWNRAHNDDLHRYLFGVGRGKRAVRKAAEKTRIKPKIAFKL